MYSSLLLALSLAALGLSVDCTIIDLTHPLSSSTLYWPGVPGFNRTTIMAGTNENNIWVEVGAFSSGEHGGTHIDVPRHFNRTGYDLSDFPIELTIADGVMIDVRDEASRNHDYTLTTHKIQEWENQHGPIPNMAAVIVNTGWSSRWPNPQLFFNTNSTTNQTTFHFPVISTEAAQWLVTNRNLKMLGLDVPGPDGPRDNTLPVHSLLLSRNIVIMENMLIPRTLPARGFRVHAAPIRIVGGTGTQTRIYAMLYHGNKASNNMNMSCLCCLFVCSLAALINKHVYALFTFGLFYFHI